MRPLTVWIVLLFTSLAVASCDEAVYTNGELVAKHKYESVKKGQSRDAVVTALGSPVFELVLDRSRMIYTFHDQTGKKLELDRTGNPRAPIPAELQFLPRNLTDSRILVYSEGTVFGYIGVGEDNVVSFVKVITS